MASTKNIVQLDLAIDTNTGRKPEREPANPPSSITFIVIFITITTSHLILVQVGEAVVITLQSITRKLHSQNKIDTEAAAIIPTTTTITMRILLPLIRRVNGPTAIVLVALVDTAIAPTAAIPILVAPRTPPIRTRKILWTPFP
ncbi:hypothetical protein MMC29_007546 [Sticta canariensis]|nr:hypothetical protein [Sticta canariensis]